jgi:hypothetical protein
MISQKLHHIFSILEMEAFPRWQKADAQGKEKISKELGEIEGKLIIKEIEEESKKINA